MNTGKDYFALTATMTANADGTVLPIPFSAKLLKVYFNATTAPGADIDVTLKKNGVASSIVGTLATANGKGSIVPDSALTVANAEIDADAKKGQHGTSITYSNGVSYGVIGTNYIGGSFPNAGSLLDFVAGDTIACALEDDETVAGAVAVLFFEKI